MVKATIESDIYYLYCDNSDNKYLAYIPSYKCSLMMNHKFRKIKENVNLDSLEESDDEDDFQNIGKDKYVNLNLNAKMRCTYNYKFKKWEPIMFVDNSTHLAKFEQIKQIEQKNFRNN